MRDFPEKLAALGYRFEGRLDPVRRRMILDGAKLPPRVLMAVRLADEASPAWKPTEAWFKALDGFHVPPEQWPLVYHALGYMRVYGQPDHWAHPWCCSEGTVLCAPTDAMERRAFNWWAIRCAAGKFRPGRTGCKAVV